MAITNAQQYRQLRRQGGIMGSNGGSMLVTPTRDGSRPGYSDTGPGGNPGDVGAGHTGDSIGSGGNGDRPNPHKDMKTPEVDLSHLGDPDPEIDVPTSQRQDTITSYSKNLNAARKANRGLTIASLFNPMFAIPTLAKTAYQTNQARGMLGLTTDTDDDDDDTGNGDGDNYIPPLMAQAPSIVEQEPEIKEEEPFEFYRRFRADGGIMNTDVVGGEYDFDSARQMYGLGKLVKKVTRTVKKIAKSDIGKAALLGAVAFGIPGMGASGGLGGGIFGRASFGGAAPGMFGFGGIGNALALGKMKAGNLLLGTPGDTGGRVAGTSLLSKIPGGITGAIVGTSLIAGMLTPKQEEEAQQISDETGIDIAEIRANPNKYLARRFKAEGGSMDEPVAKKTMPLLDMGGQEMDLRAEGGFVPIGRMEKADDVPARLSKNEFVFTADAVRNAGEGDVDKGAEVMYNMMKNLESGGEVSEESQGLEGAKEMFQTSQRLEEVL